MSRKMPNTHAAAEAPDGGAQISIRLPGPVLEQLAALAAKIRGAMPGVTATRADAARAALLAGLETLRQREPAAPSSPAATSNALAG